MTELKQNYIYLLANKPILFKSLNNDIVINTRRLRHMSLYCMKHHTC